MKKALLIIDHGSMLDSANQMLAEMVELVQQLRPELIVVGCHMELAEPSIPAGLKLCIEKGAKEVVALPYMLSPGRHATADIPRLVQTAAKEYPQTSIIVSKHLGVHQKLAELVLERAKL